MQSLFRLLSQGEWGKKGKQTLTTVTDSKLFKSKLLTSSRVDDAGGRMKHLTEQFDEQS